MSLVLALGGGAVAACEGAESYIFTARRYDPAGACLEPYAPVEVVDGPGASATCPETCLTVGTEVFVTTMCPPLPSIATELAENAEACVAARSATSSTCGKRGSGGADPDGGPSSTDVDGSAGDSAAPPGDLDAAVSDASDGA